MKKCLIAASILCSLLSCAETASPPVDESTRSGGKADDGESAELAFEEATETRTLGLLAPGSSTGALYAGVTGEGELLIRDLVEFDLDEGQTAEFILEFDEARLRCPCPFVYDYSLWLVQFGGDGEIVDGYPLASQPEDNGTTVFEPLRFAVEAPASGSYALAVDARIFIAEDNTHEVMGGWTLERLEEDDPADGYDPCAELSCGDQCSVCDPTDLNCFESSVIKQCNADGECTPEAAVCM